MNTVPSFVQNGDEMKSLDDNSIHSINLISTIVMYEKFVLARGKKFRGKKLKNKSILMYIMLL